MQFENKVVLVTGGNSGIGQSTCLKFAREGAQIAILARNQERAHETIELIEKSGGTAIFVSCDVRDAQQCEQAVKVVVEQFGKIDILINNAGIIVRNRNVIDSTLEEWRDTFDVNVHGTFYMSKYTMPHLLKSKGNVVNVSSYVGLVGFPDLVAYCASKGAVVQLTRAMALDHAADGVRVNCVCPGSVHTPMIEAAWESYSGDNPQEVWKNKHPVKRIATPEEVADAILYLASEQSSFITGVALPVDGGLTAG